MPNYYMIADEAWDDPPRYYRKLALCGYAHTSIYFPILAGTGVGLNLSSLSGNPYQAWWPATEPWEVNWVISCDSWDDDIWSSGFILGNGPSHQGGGGFSWAEGGPSGAQGVGQSVGCGISIVNNSTYHNIGVTLFLATLHTCVDIGIHDANILAGQLNFTGDVSGGQLPGHRFIRVGPAYLGKAIRVGSDKLGKIIRV